LAQSQDRLAGKNNGGWQLAVEVWLVFFVVLAGINGTVPFVLGYDMHAWTASLAKLLLVSFVVYGGISLVVPLLLIKGLDTVRKPAFLIPLIVAVVAVGVWDILPYSAAIALVSLAYLHRRFNLSGYGIRSKGWRGDVAAILLLGSVEALAVFLQPGPLTISLGRGIAAGAYRLFANPASTVENFFYFGFITERLSGKAGKFLTPPLIGAMYTAHEMSNPEYWYSGTPFAIEFVGITVIAILYLWRRSVIPVWLGDGLGKLLAGMF
jgi:hypothetical protein